MCEHFVARAAEPFRLDELWPFTERLERFGIAGFGWGAAWLDDDGRLASSSRPAAPSATTRGRERVGASRDDRRARPPAPAVEALDARPARTPSRSTTRRAATRSATTATCATTARCGPTLPRAGPDPRPGRHGGRGALARGRLATPASRRRICWARCTTASAARRTSPSSPPTATPYHYAGNDENPVFSFRLGRIGVVSTGIYSLDRSLFRYVAPGATERRLVRLRTTVALGP